jgi:hypothetical protein
MKAGEVHLPAMLGRELRHTAVGQVRCATTRHGASWRRHVTLSPMTVWRSGSCPTEVEPNS